MKNTIIAIVAVLVLVPVVMFLIFRMKAAPYGEGNHSITGGGYTLSYETNGGNKVSNEHVCIGCPPEAYVSLPVPEKEGYEFDGWYYDEKFMFEVNGETTLDISPMAKLDKCGCTIGYQDIKLYAKWK